MIQLWVLVFRFCFYIDIPVSVSASVLNIFRVPNLIFSSSIPVTNIRVFSCFKRIRARTIDNTVVVSSSKNNKLFSDGEEGGRDSRRTIMIRFVNTVNLTCPIIIERKQMFRVKKKKKIFIFKIKVNPLNRCNYNSTYNNVTIIYYQARFGAYPRGRGYQLRYKADDRVSEFISVAVVVCGAITAGEFNASITYAIKHRNASRTRNRYKSRPAV